MQISLRILGTTLQLHLLGKGFPLGLEKEVCLLPRKRKDFISAVQNSKNLTRNTWRVFCMLLHDDAWRIVSHGRLRAPIASSCSWKGLEGSAETCGGTLEAACASTPPSQRQLTLYNSLNIFSLHHTHPHSWTTTWWSAKCRWLVLLKKHFTCYNPLFWLNID